MKKLLFAVATIGAIAAASAISAVQVTKAQTTPSHALVALGFVFNGYTSDANCHTAGDAITSNVNGGTFHPNYYCVPMTNTTATIPAVGGGYGSAF
jgi:hypothetical protein